MTAFSCGPTVKKPEARKTITRPIINTLMIAKLLRKASDNACELESSGTSGGSGGSGSFARLGGGSWIWSCVVMLMAFYRSAVCPGAAGAEANRPSVPLMAAYPDQEPEWLALSESFQGR